MTKESMLLGVALLAGMAIAQGAHELVVAPGAETPQGALAKIRAAKAAGDKGAWTVRVKPGIYVLDQALVFTPADSGEPGAPVTWIGEEGKSVIAGGEPIVNWQDDGGGVWSAPLPKRADGRPAFFEQLWVDGRRAERARLPDRGFVRMEHPTCAASPDGKPNSFVEKFGVDGNLGGKLAQLASADLPYAQACIVRKWTFARRILRGYEAASRTVTTTAPAAWPGYARWDENGGTLVWFENVRSAFDAAGEWFYDAPAGRVRYRPRPGEDMAKVLVLAPTKGLSQLLVLRGDPAKGAYVHDLNFVGLTFACTATKTLVTDVLRSATNNTYVPPTEGPTESWQYQAAQSADAAVMGEGAKRVLWNRCAVRQTSNYAFRLGDGCFNCRILNSRLEDLGAGGVWLGARQGYVPPNEGDRLARRVYRTYAPQANAMNVISNCVIRQAGRVNPEGTGVAVTHASDCKVVKCDIVDILYTGVSVGWTWGFRGSVAQRNEIAFNRIANLGQGLMSDMGGVYTLGTSYGTWVHDNVIHDVKSYSYGGWALYTDEGSEGIVMERNLCWNTTDGGFHQHYGTGCVIRNNIFAWNRMAGAVRTSRPEVQNVPCSFHFHNNIVLVREGPLASWDILNVGGVWANNVWFDMSGRPNFSHNLDWAKWCATGHEVNGVYADPLFVDAAKFDFRLKPESPAFKLGFKAWDYGKAGAEPHRRLVLVDFATQQMHLWDSADTNQCFAVSVQNAYWDLKRLRDGVYRVVGDSGFKVVDLSARRVVDTFRHPALKGVTAVCDLPDGGFVGCVGNPHAKETRLYRFSTKRELVATYHLPGIHYTRTMGNDRDPWALLISWYGGFARVRIDTVRNTCVVEKQYPIVSGRNQFDAVPDRAGTGYWASGGYGCELAHFSADGRVLSRWRDPQNACFYAQVKEMPNGTVYMAHWTGHSMRDLSKGAQVVAFDASGNVVWRLEDQQRFKSVIGMDVIDAPEL